jgi:hypothetical protein
VTFAFGRKRFDTRSSHEHVGAIRHEICRDRSRVEGRLSFGNGCQAIDILARHFAPFFWPKPKRGKAMTSELVALLSGKEVGRVHGPAVVQAFLWGLLPDNERVLDRWAKKVFDIICIEMMIGIIVGSTRRSPLIRCRCGRMPIPDCRRYRVSSGLVALLRSASLSTAVNQRTGLRSLSPRLDLHTSESRSKQSYCARSPQSRELSRSPHEH